MAGGEGKVVAGIWGGKRVWLAVTVIAVWLAVAGCNPFHAPTPTPTPVLPAEITGKIVFDCSAHGSVSRDGTCSDRLPPDGSIKLLNQANRNTIAVGTVDSSTGIFPVPFTIAFDLADIDPGIDYYVLARFTTSSRKDQWTLYSGVSQPLILTKGRPFRDVEVEVVRQFWDA